jgi:hypothetical protein
VPFWLWPTAPPSASLWKRLDWRLTPRALRPDHRVPLLGTAGGPRRPALLFVLRAERVIPQSRSGWTWWSAWPAWAHAWPQRDVPVRGLFVAVEDVDAAQRTFQPWGLLARLTPEAFEWLRPRGKATSPGPEPVYGT